MFVRFSALDFKSDTLKSDSRKLLEIVKNTPTFLALFLKTLQCNQNEIINIKINKLDLRYYQ